MSEKNELILVVPTNIVVKDSWNGINPAGLETIEQIIRENSQFKRRAEVENDPSFKQIIPYMIFQYQGKVFLMQRKSKVGEARLRGMYSLGIGGHINQADLEGQSIIDWGKREFLEEAEYEGDFTSTPIGLLNDDFGEVGKVHLGYVILLEGDSNKIQVKEELESGQLVTIEQAYEKYDQMETWSKFVLDYLKERHG